MGASGVEALNILQRQTPDVIVSDIGLPQMSGYDVAQKIREQRSLDDVMLIALTGYGRAIDIANAKSAGFDAHITKPADVDVIEEILANRVQHWKAS